MSPPHVCVLAATKRELAPLREELQGSELPVTVSWAATGVGKSAAAAVATERIIEESPALLLAFGCAGAYPGSGLRVGDVVLAESEILADEGAEGPTGFLDLEELGLATARTPDGRELHHVIPLSAVSSPTWSLLEAAAAPRFRLARGPCVTVSTATGSLSRGATIEARWGPLAESLEGAAIALAAARRGCACHEIRGISNPVGPRDRAAWDIDLACRNAARIAAELLRAGAPEGA